MQQVHYYYIFASGYSLAALLHLVGLLLLVKVKTKFRNQQMITIHLAISEIFNCLFQVSVSVSALAQSRLYEWYLVLQLFIFFSGVSSKLIMMYLTMDRMFDIFLHMRYPIYFTKRCVMIVLSVLWLLSFTVGITCTILQLNILNVAIRKNIYEIRTYLFFTLDVLITVNAIIIYICLYIKVTAAQRSTHYAAGQSRRQNPLAKFVVPCILVLTYIIFNVTGSAFKMFHFWNPRKIIFVNASALLVMLGWISDACVYVFAQKDVRLYLISLIRKPAQTHTPCFSMHRIKTESVVGLSYRKFSSFNIATNGGNGYSKRLQPINAKNVTVCAAENSAYVSESVSE